MLIPTTNDDTRTINSADVRRNIGICENGYVRRNHVLIYISYISYIYHIYIYISNIYIYIYYNIVNYRY